MRQLSFVFLCSLVLAACGFEPMAGQSTKAYNQQALPSALAAVSVQATSPATKRMIGQNFRIELEDLINPGEQNNAVKEYLLNVGISPDIQPGFIAPDGKAQRYLINLSSTYSLSRLSDGKVIASGGMNRSGSYSNLPNSYYSTYIAEQDTLKRLTQELAEQYRMKLATILSSPPVEPKDVDLKKAPNQKTLEVGPSPTIKFPSGQSF